jgi:hypothetical protein
MLPARKAPSFSDGGCTLDFKLLAVTLPTLNPSAHSQVRSPAQQTVADNADGHCCRSDLIRDD